MASQGYQPRLADPYLADLMGSFPAVMITGARAIGKTTTARRRVAQIARLDEPGTANAFRADPDGVLRRAERPLLIDEWQEVPEVLAAVKRSVDENPDSGQFVLTGRVRAELTTETWAGTGRAVRMNMYGLTERELAGRLDPARPSFLQALAVGGIRELRMPAAPPALYDYIQAAQRGGFPDVAYRLTTDRARRLWLASYIDDLVTRDAATFGHGKDPGKLRAYLEALALNNAGIPTESSLYGTAGINAKTAAGYDRLLANLYVLDLVPAWPLTGNRLKALVKAPKRYLVDTGMAAAAATLSTDDILTDPGLLGRFFDAYATAQLRAEIALMETPPRVHHLRTHAGRQEIDLVFNMGQGRAIALEFKAASAVSTTDTRHLLALRDDLGERFLAGAVIYSGTQLYEIADRIFAIPLCTVWG